MGHYVFNEGRKFFIEDGKVYNAPGGPVLPLHPETLKPLTAEDEKLETVKEEDIPPAFEGQKPVVEEEVKAKKPEHLRSCTSAGRGGRYTPGCPKCDSLKKDK